MIRRGRALVLVLSLGAAGVAFADDGGVDDAGGAAPAPIDAGAGSAAAVDAGPAVVTLPLGIKAPEVHAAASPSEVRLGARFTLFITATYAEGVAVNLPEPVELGPALELRRRVSEDRVRADGKHVREWQLEVLAWELGDLQVPPIDVTFSAAGEVGHVATEAVPLRVIGVRGANDDGAALRGLAPPATLIHDDWTWLYLGAAGLGGALVGGGALIAIRRRRRRARRLVAGLVSGAAAPAVVARLGGPAQRALEALAALEASGALVDAAAPARQRAGFAELVEVIRTYLAARFGLVAVDVSSAELLEMIGGRAPALRPRLGRWLNGCDRVKYGGRPAEVDEATAALAEAQAIVLDHAPQVAVPSPEVAA